jgi:pyruvate/2-oxoglutarate dehydrogenase complex dihydrolipoamide acyltransferase (E2) component
MDKIGKYKIIPFSKNRMNIALVAREGHRKHSVHAMIELDVTNGKRLIKKNKEAGFDISFTAWLIKCVGDAISIHKELNTNRHGKRKMVIFDDVDVPIPIERVTESETRPMGYIIRKVNEKSVKEISNEIRKAQKEEIDDKTQVLGKILTKGENFLVNSPLIIQKIAIAIIRRNGFLRKKHLGTVGLTSVGSKGKIPGWVIPLGGTTSSIIAVGGITKKPGVINNKIEIREYLHVTITVDHDIVDGGPLVRFIETLKSYIENGYSLSNDN